MHARVCVRALLWELSPALRWLLARLFGTEFAEIINLYNYTDTQAYTTTTAIKCTCVRASSLNIRYLAPEQGGFWIFSSCRLVALRLLQLAVLEDRLRVCVRVENYAL